GAVEAMAAEAWSEISRLAADRKWDEARAALADFQKAFGSTKLAAAKKEEAETILKSADRAGVPAEGLIGFWKFDEGKETRAGDYGGAGNHGNIKIPSYAPGRSGMALSFDKNCVDLPLGILGTAKGSLAFWMLAARPPSDMGIVFYGSDGERGDGRGGAPGEFHVHLAADGRVGLLIRGQGRGLDMKSPGRVADGEWHHVVVTWENGRGAAIYVDGIMVARDEFKIADFQFSGRCRFGVPGYPTRHYSGLLDEARAYNRPLSESEVRRLARQ
ncbi:MAG: LamG domain-containing protein, partial [Planctomycetota bacterium]|nr:LamG domain-containing protein [Planctomycetota bacterium]